MSFTNKSDESKEEITKNNDNKNEESEEERSNQKKEKKTGKITFEIISFLIAAISIGAKFLIIIYDIFIPKTLREYVPFLNMIRKIAVPISELLAGKKSKEITEVTNELDELELKKEKVMKSYPLRRTIGQAISMGVSPLLLIVIPTVIWGETLIVKIQQALHIPDEYTADSIVDCNCFRTFLCYFS